MRLNEIERNYGICPTGLYYIRNQRKINNLTSLKISFRKEGWEEMTPHIVWKSLFGEPRKHRLIHFLIFIDAFGLPVAWHKNWVHFVFTPILVTSLPFKVPMLFDWQKFRFTAKRIFLSNVAFVGNINQWKKTNKKSWNITKENMLDYFTPSYITEVSVHRSNTSVSILSKKVRTTKELICIFLWAIFSTSWLTYICWCQESYSNTCSLISSLVKVHVS